MKSKKYDAVELKRALQKKQREIRRLIREVAIGIAATQVWALVVE